MESRRDFLKKSGAYAVPIVLTAAIRPAFAGHGYTPHGNNGLGNGFDGQPPGNPPINDGLGNGPGNPGNHGH